MENQATSFSEVALVEAVARLAGVYLSLRPVPPSRHHRLTSRLLGFDPAGQLVLAAPTAGEEKVFIPVGWDVGLFFPVGEFMLQALTRVVDHTFFRVYTQRRVDALVLARPQRLISVNQRSQPRVSLGDSACVAITLWPAEPSRQPSCGPGPAPCLGRLLNRSPSGLGVLLQSQPAFEPGQPVIARVEDPAAPDAPLYRGLVKHCTPQPGGGCLVGLGELAEVGPGQALDLVRRLSAS